MRIVETENALYRDRSVYSDDYRYRYEFNRQWAESDRPPLVWVLLNPATGDTDGKPRPTLGRCIQWSTQLGRGRLTIVNLFAFRATSPQDLRSAAQPIGELNDETLANVVGTSDLVIAAWGAHGRLLARGRDVGCSTPERSLPRTHGEG